MIKQVAEGGRDLLQQVQHAGRGPGVKRISCTALPACHVSCMYKGRLCKHVSCMSKFLISGGGTAATMY
jgi:hypothetical protein